MLILYNPQSTAGRKRVLPMSLLAVGAVLEGEHDYVIVDANVDTNPIATISRYVRENGADILAVTVMPGPQISHAVPECRELKSIFPELTIIWGGYFPTQHYDACLRAEYVDYVVRGHGELVFKALVGALRSGGDVDCIPGVAFKDPQTGVIHSNEMATIPHPNLMPEYPYHRIDVPGYVRPTFMGARTLPHHSSYGCPFHCNFCAVVNMVGGRWMAQTSSRTADLVHTMVEKWNVDAIEFYDNNFFVHEKRVADFSERILDLNINWWGEGRIDTMIKFSDRTWELMRDSGLKMVFLGAESGSDETLRLMNKGGTASTDKTLEIARKMRHYGIVPEFSFVLGNPPDPEADVRSTMEFIRKVKRVNPDVEIILYMYTPVPLAGELYDQAKAQGFQFPETLEGWIDPDWQDFLQRRSAHVPWMKDPLRREVRNFERVLNAYYPTATDPKLTGVWRLVLKASSAARYHLRLYQNPVELRILHRLLAYQRPETSGF